MIITPIITIIASGEFDISLLFTLISGALLIFYSFRFYYVKINLINAEQNMSDNIHFKLKARLNEAFFFQIIFGIVLVLFPISLRGAEGASIDTIIWIFLIPISLIGNLLILYSYRFYSVKERLIQRFKTVYN